MSGKKTGTAGEELACEILKERGYYIVARNFTCPYGEIDVVAVKDRIICFVEVKTRAQSRYGSPAEAVDLRKQSHIRNAARFFLSRYKRAYDGVDFQVVEIEVNHVRGLEL